MLVRMAVLKRCVASALSVCGLSFAAPATAQSGDRIEAAFGGQCVVSLAAGNRVPTDCAIHVKGTEGETYCFGSEASRASFIKTPSYYLQRARDFDASPTTAVADGHKIPEFAEEDARNEVLRIIKDRTRDGVFRLRDPKADADLDLEFEEIKIIRGMRGYGWFPNVMFRIKGEPERRYAVDFWLRPEGNSLRLMDVRIQKGPRRDGESWVMVTRSPVAWWWLPVSEHPGDLEIVRGWQVMSAIHKFISSERKDGLIDIRDDKTGETLRLEFVEIHQPVRRLKSNGSYFACTDFRKPGSRDEYYDVDFWLDEKSGAINVGEVRVHKVPVQEDGTWTQVPRYDFKGLDFDVVR